MAPTPPAGAGRSTVRRIVPLFRPYRLQVAAVVGLIVVTSTIGIINPLLIQAVFNKVFGNQARDISRYGQENQRLAGPPSALCCFLRISPNGSCLHQPVNCGRQGRLTRCRT